MRQLKKKKRKGHVGGKVGQTDAGENKEQGEGTTKYKDGQRGKKKKGKEKKTGCQTGQSREIFRRCRKSKLGVEEVRALPQK